ncbi:MAG TPA: (Fe-S)-binding protein [Rhizomicrobium sp.]|nr:(Fe-S)-binding protein [Rhizomicrobium sp.]
MTRPRVGLFVTCLVDLVRPRIGFAAAKLLEQAGCEVVVPTQTCCGQPAWNAGADADARAIALQVIEAFSPFDYVVAPSGSCAGMIKRHYVEVLPDDPRARALAAKTYELTKFLVDVRGVAALTTVKACYHDSCSSLRENGVRAEPRKLLGDSVTEMADRDVCCGFGGLFSVKYPEISERMADDKIAAIEATGADMLIGGDLGCLLHLEGRMRRLAKTMRVRHVAEVLAGEE